MTARLRIALPLALLILPRLALADYEYRYLEGEKFDRSEGAGLRDEGFTSWMAHPSHKQIVVFGNPTGGFVEYDVKGLGPGPYHLFIRCLALSSLTKTHVLWDGRDLGRIAHAKQGTALKWSDGFPLPPNPLPRTGGGVPGPGDHVLRLAGSPDSTQWPYIDVILLTNQDGYTPDDADADFVSYTTPWPPAVVKQADGTTRLIAAPRGEAKGPASLGVAVDMIALGPVAIGTVPISVTLRSVATEERSVHVGATLGNPWHGQPFTEARVTLKPGETRVVELPIIVAQACRATFSIGIEDDAQKSLVNSGDYWVTIPSPVTFGLDEYAYPADAKTARWTATFVAAPDALAKMAVSARVRAQGTDTDLGVATMPARARAEAQIDLSRLPVGRYEVVSEATYGNTTMLTDTCEFIKYRPAPMPRWEPVRETRAAGDTILLNGKPFLGRHLFHAPPDENTLSHGFNLVHCAAGDPDPRASIQDQLDQCAKVGLYGVVALFNNAYLRQGAEFNLAHIEQVVRQFKDHPATWGWDLIDEPDGNDIPPAKVQAAADLIRRLDPNHIVWVNLCRPDQATAYLASQDLWSFDYYPLPTLPPFSYHTWLDISDARLRGKRPLGSCLQTFVEDASKRRMPTPDELRTIALLHIIHGYKWLGFYSYYDGEPAGCLARDPALWSYTRALNSELRALEPVILAPGDWKPVTFEPASALVEAAAKTLGAKQTVIVVSNSPQAVTVRLRGITATLRPFGSQVYEIGK